MTNDYSARWFELFLDPFPADRTARQVAFLRRQLPLPTFARVLDVCAGTGRIAGPLAAAGYTVAAVDLDEAAVAAGRRRWPGVSFEAGDMRNLGRHAGTFDAVLCLWQSFGYFDEPENRRVLKGLAACLVPGGRLVLDLYHRAAVAKTAGEDRRDAGGERVESRSRLTGRRFSVDLRYGAGGTDSFDWEVFEPEELLGLGAAVGLREVLVCADFDERVPASSGRTSFQAVLEK